MAKWEIPPPDPSDTFLKRLRELEPQADERIRNQHVVSKVVLKGFAVPGSHGNGWLLTPFDLHLRHEQKPKGLKACGKMADFLKFASASAEQLWKGVEDLLPAAIEAARTGHLHDQNVHVRTIKDGIALHLVRSLRYRTIHEAITAPSIENVRQTTLHSRRSMLQAEFRNRYGFEAAGPEALAIVLEEPISKWRELDMRGAILRTSMEAMFKRVRETVRPLSVEVWHVPLGYELLISDSPAFTFQNINQGAVIKPNVAIGDSNGVALPLAQDCLAVIGPSAKDDELLPDQVVLFNRLQVTVADRYVYYRPGSALKTFVQSML
jgi:hypothetical protein